MQKIPSRKKKNSQAPFTGRNERAQRPYTKDLKKAKVSKPVNKTKKSTVVFAPTSDTDSISDGTLLEESVDEYGTEVPLRSDSEVSIEDDFSSDEYSDVSFDDTSDVSFEGGVSTDTEDVDKADEDDEDDEDDKADELGGIAYPSSSSESEKEEINASSEDRISIEDINKWSLQIHEEDPLHQLKTVQRALNSWSTLTKGQYLNKKIISQVESEDTEAALYSLVFERCSDFLWQKLSECGNCNPYSKYPKECKIIRNSIRGLLEALDLLFTHTSPGSWSQILILNSLSLQKFLPFFAPFTITFSRLLKTLISKIWVFSRIEGNESYGFDQVQSFLVLVSQSYSAYSDRVILKHTYRLWLNSLFDMSPYKHNNAMLLLDSLCSLFFSIQDSQRQYKFAFSQVKAIGLSLREGISKTKKGKKKPSRDQLVSWRFIYSVKIWAKVIGTDVTNHLLNQLKFPILQVISAGVFFSGNGFRLIPFRLHLIEIAVSTLKVVIGFPMESLLSVTSEVLDSLVSIQKSSSRKRQVANPNLLDWNSLLAGPTDCDTAEWYWNLVGKRVAFLWMKSALVLSTRADFPDVFGVPLRWIKSWLKKDSSRISGSMIYKRFSLVVQSLESHIRLIEEQRKDLNLINVMSMKETDFLGFQPLKLNQQSQLSVLYRQLADEVEAQA